MQRKDITVLCLKAANTANFVARLPERLRGVYSCHLNWVSFMNADPVDKGAVVFDIHELRAPHLGVAGLDTAGADIKGFGSSMIIVPTAGAAESVQHTYTPPMDLGIESRDIGQTLHVRAHAIDGSVAEMTWVLLNFTFQCTNQTE